MRRFTILSLIAGLALLAAGALRADDTPTPDAAKTGKPDMVQRILSKFDKNNDGAIGPDELAAFLAAHQKRVAENGTGKEGRPAPSADKLMAKFDADGDGKLETTELQAMLKELHAHHRGHHKQAPPPAAAT